MYITIDILQQIGVPENYLELFSTLFPTGTSASDFIRHPLVPNDFLHWAHTWLSFNQAEEETYWKQIGVEGSCGVDHSINIKNSQVVSNSELVENSSNIYNSNNINSSTSIFNSAYVDESSLIKNSNFIDKSTRIIRGNNVSNSSEVVDSTYIVNSHGVFEADNISDCHTIWHCENLTNCGFCFNCKNLTNAIFCFNTKDGEYLLFNQPIDKTRFEIINKQFRRYASVASKMTDWEKEPTKIRNYKTHTEDIPNAFWSWVKTLPGYNKDILYALTFNPQFLN